MAQHRQSYWVNGLTSPVLCQWVLGMISRFGTACHWMIMKNNIGLVTMKLSNVGTAFLCPCFRMFEPFIFVGLPHKWGIPQQQIMMFMNHWMFMMENHVKIMLKWMIYQGVPVLGHLHFWIFQGLQGIQWSMAWQVWALASGLPVFSFGRLRRWFGLDGLMMMLTSQRYPIYLGLFNVIFYFPNGQSTIWEIYSEYVLFLGDPLSKSKFTLIKQWCLAFYTGTTQHLPIKQIGKLSTIKTMMMGKLSEFWIKSQEDV